MQPDIDHLVILAGGKGTRLAAVAGDVPKVLVPVGGKPVLQHQLELAVAQGFRSATILAGHLAEQIEAFVGGGRFGLQVRVLVEAEPLGSAGALVQALDSLPEHFAVLYGDVMAAVDLREITERHLVAGADFTALAHPNDHPHDSDLLETDADGWVTAIHAYPHPDGAVFANLVNAALYVIRREALRPFAGKAARLDFTRDILEPLVAGGARVLAHRSTDYIKDMGTPTRLQRVEADWRSGRISLSDAARRRPAVFLDRDGVLNVDKHHLADAAGLEVYASAGPALKVLRQAGFRLVVVTNQPVLARGEASEADVTAIHRKLEWELGQSGAYLDGIYVCPHHPDAGFPGERPELKVACDCRKPGTALVERAARELRIDLGGSWMVGDQTRDMELARRAGLRSVLVRTGVAAADGKYDVQPDFVCEDIAAAAQLIVHHSQAAAA